MKKSRAFEVWKRWRFDFVGCILFLSIGILLGEWWAEKPVSSAENVSEIASLPTTEMSGSDGMRLEAVIDDWRNIKNPSHLDRLAFLNSIAEISERIPTESLDIFYQKGVGGLVSISAFINNLFSIHSGNYTRQWEVARSIQNAENRERVSLAVIRNAAKQDGLLSLELYTKLPTRVSFERSDLRREVLQIIGNSINADGMKALCDSYYATTDLLNETIASWAKSDPTSAVKFLQADSGFRFDRVKVMGLISKEASPEVVLSAVQDLPESSFKSNIIEQSIGNEVALRPEKWSNLTKGIKNEISLAKIAIKAATKSVSSSPEEATKFLEFVNSDKQREQVARDITWELLRVSKLNPDGVYKWAKVVRDPAILAGISKELQRQKLSVPKN